MEFIAYYINQGLSFIVPLIILLGLLIFVHELGHFLVAKFYGVRVEVFSLGFGKKFFKFKRGDTEYCLSVVPFGGYVKMYGDDPTADIPLESRNVSFTHKPVGQRIAVVLAGPVMNLFFAALLFFIIAIVGEEVPRALVGDISPRSPAYEYGLRPGDEVVNVNNLPVSNWAEMKELLENNGSGPVQLTIKREGQAEPLNIQAKTTLVPNPNILSSQSEVGDIEGLNYSFRAAVVYVPSEDSLAAKAGLKSGDRITALNGKPIERWRDLLAELSAPGTPTNLELSVAREGEKGKTQTTTLQLNWPDRAAVLTDGLSAEQAEPLILGALGIDRPDLYVSNVVNPSAAFEAGLQKGDKIVSVDGEITEWSDLVKRVQAFHENASPLKISALRDGKSLEFSVAPRKITQTNPAGKEIQVYAIGVMAGVATVPPLTALQRTTNPAKAATKGLADTWLWTKNTALSFLRLLQNKVSAKSIGGPIMIAQLANKTFEIGLSAFLKIMAIISINLFILNLLPVPVLDGGHLVFFTIEALRGAPLSMRKMEIAQQVGLFILVGLMILAVFNDVSRLFS